MRRLNRWNTSKSIKSRWLRKANRELKRIGVHVFVQDTVRDYSRDGIGYTKPGPYPGQYQRLALTPDSNSGRYLVWYTYEEA